MHGSHKPLNKWFWAIYLITHSQGKRVTVSELKEELGVSYQTAWSMRHKIKKARRSEDIFIKGLFDYVQQYY